MNRLGFIVLSILSQNGATNKLSSMSVQEISDTEEFGYKSNTIFKKIKRSEEFEDAGYIGRGLKEGRADTFFITDTGREFLEGAKHETK